MTTNITSINNIINNDLSVNTSTSARDIYTKINNTDNSNTSSIANLSISVGGTSAGDPFVTLSNTTSNHSIGLDNSDSDVFKIAASNSLPTTTTYIDNSGDITRPLQSSFAAYSSGVLNVTGAGAIYSVICDNEEFDLNSDYNNATGVFTAPVTGNYFFYSFSYLTGLSSTYFITQYIVSTSYTYIGVYGRTALADNIQSKISAVIPLTAGDTVYPQVQAFGEAGNTGDLQGTISQSQFACVLLQ